MKGMIETEGNTEQQQRAVALLSANISKSIHYLLGQTKESWENEGNRQVPSVFKSNWTLNVNFSSENEKSKIDCGDAGESS